MSTDIVSEIGAPVQVNNGTPGVEYRKVPGFPDYAIGNDGTVWSRKNARGGKMVAWEKINGVPSKSGHVGLTMFEQGRRKTAYVHRLVLELFVGPCPRGCECRHLNDNPRDNRLENLRWGTRSENMRDAVRNGKARIGAKHPFAKLTESDVLDIRRRAAQGESQRSIAKDCGISRATVGDIISRRTWRSVGGPEHQRRWLTEEDVKEIRRRRTAGESVKSIANDFNKCVATIYHIMNGIHWRNVE